MRSTRRWVSSSGCTRSWLRAGVARLSLVSSRACVAVQLCTERGGLTSPYFPDLFFSFFFSSFLFFLLFFFLFSFFLFFFRIPQRQCLCPMFSDLQKFICLNLTGRRRSSFGISPCRTFGLSKMPGPGGRYAERERREENARKKKNTKLHVRKGRHKMTREQERAAMSGCHARPP